MRKARNRARPTPSLREDQPLCSAPASTGSLNPCMRGAAFVVNPGGDASQHLCVDHYQRFLNYWAEAGAEEARPQVRALE